MNSEPMPSSTPVDSVISVEEARLHDPERAVFDPDDRKPRAHSHMVELVLAEPHDDADAPGLRAAPENAPDEGIGHSCAEKLGTSRPTALGEQVVSEEPAGL